MNILTCIMIANTLITGWAVFCSSMITLRIWADFFCSNYVIFIGALIWIIALVVSIKIMRMYNKTKMEG